MREVWGVSRLRLSEVYLYREVSDGVHSLLHHVLDAGQRLLDWHWGLWAASLLGELQDGHVAQWTHLPHL